MSVAATTGLPFTIEIGPVSKIGPNDWLINSRQEAGTWAVGAFGAFSYIVLYLHLQQRASPRHAWLIATCTLGAIATVQVEAVLISVVCEAIARDGYDTVVAALHSGALDVAAFGGPLVAAWSTSWAVQFKTLVNLRKSGNPG